MISETGSDYTISLVPSSFKCYCINDILIVHFCKALWNTCFIFDIHCTWFCVDSKYLIKNNGSKGRFMLRMERKMNILCNMNKCKFCFGKLSVCYSVVFFLNFCLLYKEPHQELNCRVIAFFFKASCMNKIVRCSLTSACRALNLNFSFIWIKFNFCSIFPYS